MFLGNKRENHAQRRATANVWWEVPELARSEWWMPHIMLFWPAKRAAKPPKRLEWYIQVCTACGLMWRMVRHNIQRPDSLTRPRGISRAVTEIPSCLSNGPYFPAPVSEMTLWISSGSFTHSRNKAASAPPSLSPVIMWTIIFEETAKLLLPIKLMDKYIKI